jgi:hypothetical protein
VRAPADDAALVALADTLDAVAQRGTPIVTEPTLQGYQPREQPLSPQPARRRSRPDAGPRAALLALRTEVAKAVVGQDAAVSGLVVALLCRGHVLLEGVPGVAKTLLVRRSPRHSPSTPSACSSLPT